jgi:hypothetical protein
MNIPSFSVTSTNQTREIRDRDGGEGTRGAFADHLELDFDRVEDGCSIGIGCGDCKLFISSFLRAFPVAVFQGDDFGTGPGECVDCDLDFFVFGA